MQSMPAGSKRLYVLRHAKSSWDDPGLEDRERPLSGRGRRSAQLISEHLRKEGIEPDLVLCSSARRTKETLELVDPTGERLVEDELYGASAGEWIERLKQVPSETGSVLVIGHNPSLQKLVLGLGGPDGSVQDKFPTAALATLELTGAWDALEPGGASLTGLVRPRDLA